MKAKYINESLNSSTVGFIEEIGEIVQRRHRLSSVKELMNDYGITKLDILELADTLYDMYDIRIENEWNKSEDVGRVIYNHDNLIEDRVAKSYTKSNGPILGLDYNNKINKWM